MFFFLFFSQVCILKEGFLRLFDPAFRKPFPKLCQWRLGFDVRSSEFGGWDKGWFGARALFLFGKIETFPWDACMLRGSFMALVLGR